MRVFIVLFAVLAVAVSQRVRPVPGMRLPILPAAAPVEEVYAASLGGAPVGLYDKRTDGRYGLPGLGYGLPGLGLPGLGYGLGLGMPRMGLGFPYGLGLGLPYGLGLGLPYGLGYGRGEEISGASLGGAPVGIYGKDRH